MPDFYKMPDSVVRPGDIVRLAPIYRRLKESILVSNQVETRKKPDRKVVDLLGVSGSLPIPDAVRNGEKDTRFVVPGHHGWAVLLTRGCDVEHSRVRQVAPIFPLTRISDEGDRVSVIEGKHVSTFYFPEPEADFSVAIPDSFADLRYTLTLDQDLFNALDRPLALTRDALLTLYLAWIKHVMGGGVRDSVECAACGADVRVFDLVESSIVPPTDY
jgi:hypothetical protein